MTDELTDLRLRVEADPADFDSRRLLVEELLTAGDFDTACEHANALVELLPNHHWVYELAERACSASGNTLGARRMQRDGSNIRSNAADHPSHPGLRPHYNAIEDLVVQLSPHSLSDIVGLATVKQHLLTITSHVSNHRQAKRQEAWPGGTLLYGPTGCGKRFCATVIAHELNCSVFALPAEFEDAPTALGNRLRTGELDNSVLLIERIDEAAQVESLEAVLHTAATKHQCVVIGSATYPWRVSSGLSCNARLDAVVLVLPPDPPARTQYLTRLIPEMDQEVADWLVAHSEGQSFEELSQMAALLGPQPTLEQVRGVARSIPADSVRWLTVAGHQALMNESTGLYDDLIAYFRARQP